MRFDDDRVDTSGVDDLRGGGGPHGGGGQAGGVGGGGMGDLGGAATVGVLAQLLRGKGGVGMVLGLLVLGAFIFLGQGLVGGDSQPTAATLDTGSASGSGSGDLATRCNQPGAITKYSDCLLVKAFNETDEVWDQEFRRMGETYTAPRLVFFTSRVKTACGNATTDVGPFYCPGDNRIYFDLGFADQLKSLGVKGDYANVYIMAHEFGHHLQNILGIDDQVRTAQQRNPRSARKFGVAMELQADCFAGAWGRMANDRGNVAITPSELSDAQNAAAAVGDDRIQQSAGARVNPEQWTHGSAQQRREWYMIGYNSGDINRCNTYRTLGLA